MGADDYLPKPFAMRELTARIKAILRRTEDISQWADKSSVSKNSAALNRINLGALQLDLFSHCLIRPDGIAVALSKTEFALLHYLSSHPGQILNRE